MQGLWQPGFGASFLGAVLRQGKLFGRALLPVAISKVVRRRIAPTPVHLGSRHTGFQASTSGNGGWLGLGLVVSQDHQPLTQPGHQSGTGVEFTTDLCM